MNGAGVVGMQATPSGALREVEVRRSELGEALDGLDRALDLDPESSAAWRLAVADRLHGVERAFAVHIGVTEGPGALHDEILAGWPRLGYLVERLRTEHVEIREALDEADDALARPLDDAAVAALCEQLRALVTRVRAHRRTGRTLIHEAYDVDLGPGD